MIKFRTDYENPWTDPGEVFQMEVGNWRYMRPVVNMNKCNNCARCFFFCPTGCIEEKGDYFAANLTYCKGCGVCARECPLHAIAMIDEVQMAGKET
jgi:2-oxoacid:acceptor oxidoreductase delta subunit (pyruvate/2-ketoisovalerate family)